MVKMKMEELEKLAMKVLVHNGVDENKAKILTDVLIDDELRGKRSHGFAHLPRIIDVYKKSKNKEIVIQKETEFSALVDGGENLGPIAAHYSMKLAIDKALKRGISIIGTVNPDPFLTAGYYAKMAVDSDLIGIIAANSKARIIPWGGIDPIFGVNPIAIGIPTNDKPIILDMAISRITISDIKAAKRDGKPIPSEVAINKEGYPTTDPDEALGGALYPIDSYKGYGLALIIELLAGPLINAKAGTSVKGSRGYLFIAINPTIFVDYDEFKNNASTLLSEIKNSRKNRSNEEILYPGEKSENHREIALKDGIEISENVMDKVKELLE